VHKSLCGEENFSLIAVKECLQRDETVVRKNAPVVNDEISPGRGFIFLASLTDVEYISSEAHYPFRLKQVVRNMINEWAGIEINTEGDEFIGAYFSSGAKALQCAAALQKRFLINENFAGFKIALSNIASSDQHTLSLEHAVHLCYIATDATVICDGSLKEVITQNDISFECVKILYPLEEKFAADLFVILLNRLADDEFNVDALSRYIGISRPQLYRKVHALTGRSPNVFIRDLRMEKAVSLLRLRNKNICEVALEVGYTNPSYFARTFSEKYGCTPSGFLTCSE
jgi:AraC-like DNA-binding protein